MPSELRSALGVVETDRPVSPAQHRLVDYGTFAAPPDGEGF